MNDIKERYLYAVSSYFIGRKRKQVYNDLNDELDALEDKYDNTESLLLSYGHPLSIAYTYGYRPLIGHQFNKRYIKKMERNFSIVLLAYLALCTTYYLYQLNCLPFFQTTGVSSTIKSNTILTWILTYPFFIILFIAAFCLILLVIDDLRHPVTQEKIIRWTRKELYDLPEIKRYPNQTISTYIMAIYLIYFVLYTIIFLSPLIIQIQNTTYQMIHLMVYFFQPYMLMIVFDYFADMTRKLYSKRYILYTTIINLFIFLSMSVFVVNSGFLKDYLLPFNMSYQFDFINLLIIISIIMIYMITIYKLTRNFNAYRKIYFGRKDEI